MPDTELAEELLQIEEADAWFEYLEATRAQSETRYARGRALGVGTAQSAPPCRSRPPRAAPPGRGVDRLSAASVPIGADAPRRGPCGAALIP